MTSATYSDHDHWHQLTQDATSARAHYDLQERDPEAEEAFSAYNEAWGRMIEAPAPTVEAIAFKVRSLIEMICLETGEDRVDDPAFLQRLLDGGGGGASLVWILKDALRLAGGQ